MKNGNKSKENNGLLKKDKIGVQVNVILRAIYSASDQLNDAKAKND